MDTSTVFRLLASKLAMAKVARSKLTVGCLMYRMVPYYLYPGITKMKL